MTNEKVFAMSFAKVYPMLIAKAERKGRSRDEVFTVTEWLTGYSHEKNVCVDLPTINGNFRKTTVALKYHPNTGEMSIVTVP